MNCEKKTVKEQEKIGFKFKLQELLKNRKGFWLLTLIALLSEIFVAWVVSIIFKTDFSLDNFFIDEERKKTDKKRIFFIIDFMAIAILIIYIAVNLYNLYKI